MKKKRVLKKKNTDGFYRKKATYLESLLKKGFFSFNKLHIIARDNGC